MMKFVETKDYSCTKIKAEAKNWTTETIITALARSWEKIGRHNYTTIVKQWRRHLKRL